MQTKINFLIFTGLIIFLTACNNSGQKKDVSDTLSQKENELNKLEAEKQIVVHSYQLSEEQLKNILNQDRENKELVLQLIRYEVSGKNTKYKLIAYCTDGKNHGRSKVEELTIVPNTEKSFLRKTAEIWPQQVSRGQLKTLFGDTTTIRLNTIITDNKIKGLLFTPSNELEPEEKGIYFHVTIGNNSPTQKKININGQTYTNPSPPARPCAGEEELCDF